MVGYYSLVFLFSFLLGDFSQDHSGESSRLPWSTSTWDAAWLPTEFPTLLSISTVVHTYLFFKKKVVFLLCMCLYDGGQGKRRGWCYSIHVDIRGQFCVTSFLLLPLGGFWVLNLDLQACTTSTFTK